MASNDTDRRKTHRAKMAAKKARAPEVGFIAVQGKRSQAQSARPLDVWAQVDNSIFSCAFGIQPDRRGFSLRTHRLSKSTATFVQVWAFTLVFVAWKRGAAA